jgi:hypothetical protein
MRTTVTLDPDVAAFLQRSMRERHLTFKDALNDAVRAGMSGRRGATRQPFPTHAMGEPKVDVTHALRLAGELEDQELSARLRRDA